MAKQYALNTDYSLFVPVFPDFKPLNQREMAPACFRLISTFVPWSSVFFAVQKMCTFAHVIYFFCGEKKGNNLDLMLKWNQPFIFFFSKVLPDSDKTYYLLFYPQILNNGKFMLADSISDNTHRLHRLFWIAICLIPVKLIIFKTPAFNEVLSIV